jgi:hypothetical protein
MAYNSVDKILIDREMLENLRVLIMHSQEQLEVAQRAETLLVLLADQLVLNNSPEAIKMLQLLNFYLVSVPGCLSQVKNYLEEAREMTEEIRDSYKL